MPGSVESIALTAVVLNEKLLEQLPEEHDPRDLILENGFTNKKLTGETAKEDGEIVLGKNMHSTCFDITEPNEGDEISGDREAYMAGVVTKYQQFLTEKTKHHLVLLHRCNLSLSTTLDCFARLWEIEKEEYWGYITNGGTEGNLHGILVGREVLPDGVLYASGDSHYSVFKAARMFRMDFRKVDTLISGEIDCADLKAKLLLNKDKPAIINLNIGTTVKGAVDNLDLVIKTLNDTGYTHDRFYIHCDGALSGPMIPFVKGAPKITFKKPIGSISVSGHKFIGCPMPCGVQITRLEHINALSRNIEYLASRDATITGSRNGHSPIILWYALNKKGYRGLDKEVQQCIRNARYLQNRLQDEGISAMLNELSSTVVFERPKDEEFVRRWQLACQGGIAHVVVLSNVTVEKIDDFVNELVQKRLTWFQDAKVDTPCIAAEIGKECCACAVHKQYVED